jgi:hypothetical protein
VRVHQQEKELTKACVICREATDAIIDGATCGMPDCASAYAADSDGDAGCPYCGDATGRCECQEPADMDEL